MATNPNPHSNALPQIQIHVRPYRNSDFEETRQIFLKILVGDESAFTLAMRQQFKTPISLGSYAIIIFGLALFLLAHESTSMRNVGIVLSFLGASIFCYSRYSLQAKFDSHIEKSLTGDLADIGKHYGMIDDSDGKASSPATRKEKSGFWVAEAVEDGKSPAIVGCVGLDGYTSTDETSAELRRLVISPRHRHQGIGQKLIRTVVQFAREHQIKTIFLTTSSYQQPAINLYKKLGFNLAGKREMSIQMQKWQIYSFKLEVENFRV